MKTVSKRLLSVLLATIIMFAFQITTARASLADVTLEDMKTIVRTIGFLKEKPTDNAIMAIIYNPQNSKSANSAEQIKALINNENKNITPRLIPISRISEIKDIDFAFVAEGLDSYYPSIKTTLNEKEILSFTRDRSCVDQGYCAIYIKSKGHVEIVVNKAVIETVKAEFKPIFLMMVTVI